MNLGRLDRVRLDRALIECGPGVAVTLVLQDVLVHTEVVGDIGLDQLHLFCVDRVRLLLDLLDVRVCRREQQQAAGLAAQVLRVEALALFGEILGLRDVAHTRHEAEGRTVHNAFLDALLLHVDQIQRAAESLVRFAEEVVLILVPGDHSALIERERSRRSVQEGVPEPRHAVDIQQLALVRENREEAADLAGVVIDRNDEDVVLNLQDRPRPVVVLVPGHKRVRLRLQAPAELRLRSAVDGHFQLCRMPGERVDRGPAQVALIHLPVPGRESRCIGRQGLPECRLPDVLRAFEKKVKKSHVSLRPARFSAARRSRRA